MFEVHITCFQKDAEAATRVAAAEHWKTSQIAGDPVLGKDTYFYLTTHGADLPRTMGRLALASTLLKEAGVEVVREKIEVIIYDTKQRS